MQGFNPFYAYSNFQGTQDIRVDFGARHRYSASKHRFGLAQNLKNCGGPLEGFVTMSWNDLRFRSFSGACEFDIWFKDPGTLNPMITGTVDGSNRQLTMSITPSSVATAWASLLNGYSIVIWIQLIGTTPEYQPLVTYEPRRHPYGSNLVAAGDIKAKWIKGTNWPAPINWSLQNEFGRTGTDCKKGKDLNNNNITETDEEYAVRRSSYKQDALGLIANDYRETFNTNGTKDPGPWSTVSLGSLISGDFKLGNGKGLPDGRTFMQGVWDTYDTSIITVAKVLPNAFACFNNFGARLMRLDDNSGYNGNRKPVNEQQGWAGLGKIDASGDGTDGESGEEVPASDTRMGPVCEIATAMTAECASNELAYKHWSFTLGGVDSLATYNSPGNYTKHHRYTGLKWWMQTPTRRVPMQYLADNPIDGIDFYAKQGPVMGIAGIDPGNQTAQVLLWNEHDYPVTHKLSLVNLPANLQAVSPVYKYLDEANPLGVTATYPGDLITLQPRTMHQIRWDDGVSPEVRTNPLADGVRTPVYKFRDDFVSLPKGACGYTDQVIGVMTLTNVYNYSSDLYTGFVYANMPDNVYLTCFKQDVDNAAATFVVDVTYTGGGKVNKLTTTVGAVADGAVLTIPILTGAPVGWDVGAREAHVTVTTNGASTQSLQVWYSGTLVKANAIKGL